MTLEAKRVWMCSVCETVHDNEYEAEECCPPEVWEMYQCPVCDETHDTEEEALECCQEIEDDEEALGTGYHRQYPKGTPWGTNEAKMYIAEFIRLNRYVKG